MMIKIAVGVGENKNIIKAVEMFKKQKDDIEMELVESDDDLVKAILNDEINSVVRGSLPASSVMKQLKSKFKDISRATYVNGEYEFLLAPVGIDEGNNLDEKLKIAINCGNFLRTLGKKPKIAVLADGREGDYGRSDEISASIDDSRKLTELIKENTDFDVENYFILIERAIKDNRNVIIAPDGIIGNIIFRTLILLNSWPSYGAVTFGVSGTYIDTSRDQTVEGYLRSLNLAYDLANIYNRNNR